MTNRSLTGNGAGNRIVALLVFLLAALAVGTVGGSAAGEIQKDKTQDKKQDKKPKQQAYALLAGTVFDENGRRLPDAAVQVREKAGKRHWDTASDATGEFAVRLPPGAAVYIVTVNRRGFSSASQEVSINADERQDLSITIVRGGTQGP